MKPKSLFMAEQYAASAPHDFSLPPLPTSCKVQRLFLGICCLQVERELEPPKVHPGILSSKKEKKKEESLTELSCPSSCNSENTEQVFTTYKFQIHYEELHFFVH